MLADEARAILSDLRMTVGDVAEMLEKLGDGRPAETIRRQLYSAISLNRGETLRRDRVPPMVAAVLRLLALYRGAVSDRRFLRAFAGLRVRKAVTQRRVKLRGRKRAGSARVTAAKSP